MDAPNVHGEDTKLIDIMPDKAEKMPDSQLMRDSLRIEIERALDTLFNEKKKLLCYIMVLVKKILLLLKK